MPYPLHTLARRLLENDPEALGQVLRWISTALTSPRFWSLRGEWPDLVQEVLTRSVDRRGSAYDGAAVAGGDPRVHVRAQEFYGPPRLLGAAYTQYEETFLNNPATGQAWTVQDVRNAKLIYQHVAGENILPRAKLTQIVLVVTVERLP